MEEIEVKVIEIDKEEIIKKLKKLGAEKVFEGEIYGIHYDFEDSKLRNNNSFIRLRRRGDKSYMTFKSKKSQEQAKIYEEHETEIKDMETAEKILHSLGLKPYVDYYKYRTSFKIDDVLFEIDEWRVVPDSLEIEAPSVEIINKWVEKLSIDKDKVKPWSGKQLLEHYGRTLEELKGYKGWKDLK